MDYRAGFLAALQEGTVPERRVTRRVYADWLDDQGETTEAQRQRILAEEPFRNALGMEFAHLPPGTFWMGGANGKCGPTQVTIDHDFYLGIYPVTQAEWRQVMGNNPSWYKKKGRGSSRLTDVSDADINRFPVECVSWTDCQTFVQTLNEHCNESGWTYRLPREAEWEYACRGAATSPEDCAWSYYFLSPTNTLSPQQANFWKSTVKRPYKVGSYPPNTLGLHDMHGNIWEWCEDLWEEGASSDSSRVIRGGGWDSSAERCRAAFRGDGNPSDRLNHRGLRLARVHARLTSP